MLLEYFYNLQNVDEAENVDGVGQCGDSACGDFLKVWIIRFRMIK